METEGQAEEGAWRGTTNINYLRKRHREVHYWKPSENIHIFIHTRNLEELCYSEKTVSPPATKGQWMKSPVLGMGYSFFSCWSMRSHRHSRKHYRLLLLLLVTLQNLMAIFYCWKHHRAGRNLAITDLEALFLLTCFHVRKCCACYKEIKIKTKVFLGMNPASYSKTGLVRYALWCNMNIMRMSKLFSDWT